MLEFEQTELTIAIVSTKTKKAQRINLDSNNVKYFINKMYKHKYSNFQTISNSKLLLIFTYCLS